MAQRETVNEGVMTRNMCVTAIAALVALAVAGEDLAKWAECCCSEPGPAEYGEAGAGKIWYNYHL